MKSYRTGRKSGFTLVEILIVVIILGILAAVVIPQFTNASTDAKASSARSQLQTLRSQIELYKLQHNDTWPTADGTATGAWDWTKLTTKTTSTGAAGGTLGPYLQQTPVNPLNSNSAVAIAATDAAAATTAIGSNGFVFSSATGKIWAFEGTNTDTDSDNLFNE